MAWILICKRCKFGEKNFYNSRDIEFFLGDYFFLARPVCIYTQLFSLLNNYKVIQLAKPQNLNLPQLLLTLYAAAANIFWGQNYIAVFSS